MALVAGVLFINFLRSQMIRHNNGFNDLFRSCLNGPVMAAQAESCNLSIPLHWQCTDFLSVFNVIRICSMAELAGYGLMEPCHLVAGLIWMALDTGWIGHEPHWPVCLFHDGISTVMPVFAE